MAGPPRERVNAGVSGRPTGGAWRVAAFAAPWVQRPLRGGAGPPSLWSASGRPRAGGGGGGGGFGGVPRCPPPAPWRRPPTAAGGRPGGSGLGGPAADRGEAYSSLASPQPYGAGPSCRPSLGSPAPPAVAARCRLAGGGGEGQCVLGAVVRVSGQRLAGCGRCPRPPSQWRWRAPLCRTVRWGGVRVGGPGSAWGGVPRHCPLSPSPRPSPGPMRRGRHRRRSLCGGWVCGGGGFDRR